MPPWWFGLLIASLGGFKVAALETTICEDEQASLNCGDDDFISIQSATYGRLSWDVCAQGISQKEQSDINCSAPDTKETLTAICGGPGTCLFTVDNPTMRSDPCPGVEKYLYIEYTCESTKSTGDQSRNDGSNDKTPPRSGDQSGNDGSNDKTPPRSGDQSGNDGSNDKTPPRSGDQSGTDGSNDKTPPRSGNQSGNDGSNDKTPPRSGNQSGNDGSNDKTPPRSGNQSGNDGSNDKTPPRSGNQSGNDGSNDKTPARSGDQSGNDGSNDKTPPCSGDQSGNDGSNDKTPPRSGDQSGNDGSNDDTPPSTGACLIPTPNIFGGGTENQPMNFERYQALTIEAKPDVDCKIVKKVKFLWTSRKNSEEVDVSSLPTSSSLILRVPAKFLDYGTYEFLFQVTVSVKGGKKYHADVTTWVKIVPSELMAAIAGGSARSVGWSSSFSLDGSGSMDPDTGNNTGLEFTWRCADDTGANIVFGTDCFSADMNLSSHVITFPKETLSSGKTYIFRLDVSKVQRDVVHAYQRVGVEPGDPLELVVTCLQNCKRSLNPSSRFVLEVKCNNCDRGQDVEYIWSLVPGQGSVVQDLTWDDDTLTGRGKYNLVVKAGVFSGEQPDEYAFRVTASHRESQASGFGMYTVTVNTAPTLGTCTISPTSGFALETKFSISCLGFSDTDHPLSYEFIIRSTKATTGETVDELLSYGEDHTMSPRYLPLGDADNNYMVQIVVLVKDAFGAGAEVVLNAKVETPATAPNLQNLATELDKMLTTGNAQTATQLATVIGSALNAESEGNQTEEQKDARIEMRSSLITSLSSVKVDSIESLKQTTSALSAVTTATTELNAASQAGAASALQQMSSFLSAKASEGSSADIVEESARLLVNGLSNILGSAVVTSLLEDDDVTDGTSQDPNEFSQQNRNVTLASMTALRDLKAALSTNKVVGEEPTIVKTDSLAMVLDKRAQEDILGGSFDSPRSNGTAGTSSIKMPMNLPLGSSPGPLYTEMVEFNVNPFRWAENSEDIKSSVMEFSLKQDGRELKIDNLADPISIYLPQNTRWDDPVILNVSAMMMAYTEFNLTQDHTAMFLNVSFDIEDNIPPESWLKVYVRHGHKPNPYYYDFMINNFTKYGEDYIAQVPPHQLTDLGMYHLGVMLRNMTDPYSYDLGVSSSASHCRYWDTSLETWRDQGCLLGPDTLPSLTHCLCDHLTAFGSTWLVMPNKLNLSEDIAKFLTFWENPVTIASVLVLTIIYIVMMVWARRKDKAEAELLGVYELVDNDPLAKHGYLVTIFNGSRRHAGTTACVTLTLIGSDGGSEPHLLFNPAYQMSQTGAVDTILLRTKKDLGELKSIRFWHDNTGSSPDWFVSHVTVQKLETQSTWCFLCYTWLSVNIGDGVLDKVFPVATREDRRQFNHIFTTRMSRGLKDSHLYFSIFVRPTISNFTRVQRLSCCFCLLLCILLTNIMFYGVDTDPDSQGIPDLDLGAFVFNWKSFMISIESAVIVLPINILLVELFRRSRPRHPRKYHLDLPDQEPRGDAIDPFARYKKKLYDYFQVATTLEESEQGLLVDDLDKILRDELTVDEQQGARLYTANDLTNSEEDSYTGEADVLKDSFFHLNIFKSDSVFVHNSEYKISDSEQNIMMGASPSFSHSDTELRDDKTHGLFTNNSDVAQASKDTSYASLNINSNARPTLKTRSVSHVSLSATEQSTNSSDDDDFHEVASKLSDCRQALSTYLLLESTQQVLDECEAMHNVSKTIGHRKNMKTSKKDKKNLMPKKLKMDYLQVVGMKPAAKDKDKIEKESPSKHPTQHTSNIYGADQNVMKKKNECERRLSMVSDCLQVLSSHKMDTCMDVRNENDEKEERTPSKEARSSSSNVDVVMMKKKGDYERRISLVSDCLEVLSQHKLNARKTSFIAEENIATEKRESFFDGIGIPEKGDATLNMGSAETLAFVEGVEDTHTGISIDKKEDCKRQLTFVNDCLEVLKRHKIGINYDTKLQNTKDDKRKIQRPKPIVQRPKPIVQRPKPLVQRPKPKPTVPVAKDCHYLLTEYLMNPGDTDSSFGQTRRTRGSMKHNVTKDIKQEILEDNLRLVVGRGTSLFSDCPEVLSGYQISIPPEESSENVTMQGVVVDGMKTVTDRHYLLTEYLMNPGDTDSSFGQTRRTRGSMKHNVTKDIKQEILEDNLRLVVGRRTSLFSDCPEVLSGYQISVPPEESSENVTMQGVVVDGMKTVTDEGSVSQEEVLLDFDVEEPGPSRKDKCWDGMLPWWFIYFAWVLLFLVSVTAAFFTMLYGLNYGQEKSWNWLITVLATMFVDILCLQPLKVLGLAVFFALVLKRGEDEVLVRAKQLKEWKPWITVEQPHLVQHRRRLEEMRKTDPKYRPPPEADVLQARQHHHQQKRMLAILKEIVGYITYIWVVLLIAYAQRDPQAYYLGNFVKQTVFGTTFTEIKDFSSAWHWMNTTLVGSLYSDTSPGFLKGELLFIVGQPQLRQIRTLKSGCLDIEDYISVECEKGAMNVFEEDTYSYCLSWLKKMKGEVNMTAMSCMSRLQTAYIYQTGETLHSLPSLGEMFAYSSGGYVMNLGSTAIEAHAILTELYHQLWLDPLTMAVLVEFTLYSANTNLFCVVTGVLEFPYGGSAVVSSMQQPIRLYRYTTPVHIVVMACEIFYCAFMIGFIVAAILSIIRQKLQYFQSLWNWLQIAIILVSIVTIVIYIIRSAETSDLINRYKNDRTQFISFAHAAVLDTVLGYLIAILVVLGTLKFLHLLRFNPQIFYFLRTLSISLATIHVHLLSLVFILIAYSGFGAMMFGRHVRDYSSFPQAMMNLFVVSFGYFNYEELTSINKHAARFFLFTFVAVSNYLIINIIISSILSFYSDVMAEGAPNEDTELLLLMLQRVGEFLGLKVFKANDEKHKED